MVNTKKLIFTFTILFLLSTFNIVASASWEVNLTVTSDDASIDPLTVTFGENVNSTDGYDPDYDEIAAPPAQPGAHYFHVYFPTVIWGYSRKLAKDIKPGGPWELHVDTNTAYTVSWDISSVPTDINLTIDGTDMRTEESHHFDASTSVLNITKSGLIGPASSITVSANPTSLTADGSSQSTITATVLDANDNPVTDETVTMEVTGPGIVGSVINNEDGSYTATYTAGTTTGSATITATATAVEPDISDTVEISLYTHVPSENNPPSITAIKDKEVIVGSTITIEVEAFDPDNDTLSYSAADLPTDATFDSETHKFNWTPSSEQMGAHTVSFSVSDGEYSDTESVTITVKLPVLTLEPETGSITDTVKITGTKFVPEETVNIDFGGVALTANADIEGTFTKEFILKQALAEGDITVTATGESSGASVSTTFTYSDTKGAAISSIKVEPEGPYKAGDIITVSVEQRDDFDIADSGNFAIGESISSTLNNDGTTTWKGTYTVKKGDDGTAKVAAELQDVKGNKSSIETQDSVTIDTVIVIDSVSVEGSPVALGKDLTITLEGESETQATYEIEGVTGSIEMPEPTEMPGTYTATYTAKEGQNVENAKLIVVLTDAAGNSISDTSQTVTIDTTAPSLTNKSADSVFVNKTFVISVLSEAYATVTADVSELNAEIAEPITLEAGEVIEKGTPYTGEVKVIAEEAGMKTVAVTAQDIAGNKTTLDLNVEVIASTQFTVWLNPGPNLIHIPVADPRFEKTSDLYSFLIEEGVELQMLIYYDSKDEAFEAYGGWSKAGAPEDIELKSYIGVIAILKDTAEQKAVTFEGGKYEKTDVPLLAGEKGINLVGLPVNDPDIETLSDLSEALGDKLTTLIAQDEEGKFVSSVEAGDLEVTGGDAFIAIVKADATLKLEGKQWANEEVPAGPSIPIVKPDLDSAEVMVVQGTTVLEETHKVLNGLNITVSNLSTRLSQTDVSIQGKYSVVFVNTSGASVAKVDDVLRISVQDPSGRFSSETVEYCVTDNDIRTGVLLLEELQLVEIPKESVLLPNYPNPFNPDTWIPYQLAKDAEVTISIYDVTGRLVRTLELGQKRAGIYADREQAAYWDGRTQTGELAASGIYYYTVQTSGFSSTRKMMLLK